MNPVDVVFLKYPCLTMILGFDILEPYRVMQRCFKAEKIGWASNELTHSSNLIDLVLFCGFLAAPICKRRWLQKDNTIELSVYALPSTYPYRHKRSDNPTGYPLKYLQ